MLALHTESEIRTLYRQAKDKYGYERILAQLNACTVNQIRQIIGKEPLPSYNNNNKDEGEKRRDILSERTQMYKDGKSDKDMAKTQKVAIATIATWRNKRGLPPNKPPAKDKIEKAVNMEYSETHKRRHEAKMTLYLNGLTDSQMGKLLGCTRVNIRMWRIKNDLKSNS